MATGRIIEVENARIIYPNFRGLEGQYNKKGDRNFVIKLSEEEAQPFIDAGIRVKTRPSRDYEDEQDYLVRVNVNMESEYPPHIVMITRRNQTVLDSESVGLLDKANIESVDLAINIYRRRTPDGKGIASVTAYLNEMYVTIFESRLREKYEREDNPIDE